MKSFSLEGVGGTWSAVSCGNPRGGMWFIAPPQAQLERLGRATLSDREEQGIISQNAGPVN